MEIDNTPGPWAVLSKRCPLGETGDYETVVYVISGTKTVCYCPEVGEDEEEVANANLIAAAPDLRDALLAITSNPHIFLSDLIYDVREREGQGWDGPHVKQWSDAVEKVKNVLQSLGHDQPI